MYKNDEVFKKIEERIKNHEIIPPKSDYMFKKIFWHNKKHLKSLLSGLLKIPYSSIGSIEYLNTEFNADNLEGKSVRMDLTVRLNSDLVNVEIQVRNEKNYIDRTLYYWSRLFSRGLKSGQGFDMLPKTIIVNILDFELFEDDDYFHQGCVMLDKSNVKLSDKLSLQFFEMKKIGKKLERDDVGKLWLQFLRSNTREDLEMVKAAENKNINSAADSVISISDDPKAWYKQWVIEKAETDYNARMASARNEGLKEGEAKGEAKGIKAERQKWMEKIKKLNLSDEELEQLLN